MQKAQKITKAKGARGVAQAVEQSKAQYYKKGKEKERTQPDPSHPTMWEHSEKAVEKGIGQD
jgi:hypothetical protein